MSALWTPGGSRGMSPGEQAEADAMAKAFVEMTGYLAAGDVAGADAYMETFLRERGQFAHDTVLQMIQTVTLSPDWRTFS